ncbi:MAG: DnaJ domain-containing protein [Hyphomicrobium sp.]|nr:DnaJ domain-containing protein [Hyphomicrobium sp.]
MSDNLYDILGVQRRASDEEIRQAFRKLAKEHHPDLNAGNAAAAERFKKISAANEILSDPDRRRQYDAGEIDAKGDPRGPQYRPRSGGQQRGRANNAGSFDDFGFSDIFSDVFGGRSGAAGPGMGGFGGARAGRGFSPRGQDLRYTLEVDLIEAATGAKKRVTLPEGGTLDLTVPEGVVDGQVLRLKGRGAPGPAGAEAGDALVEIKVKPHAQFKRQGDDILVDVPITIDEAVLGAKVEIPTITGRVQLTIPKGTSSGKTFRLKGKGVKGKSGVVGDELVTVRIVLPETIDDSLSYFFSEWRQKNAYDPGRK